MDSSAEESGASEGERRARNQELLKVQEELLSSPRGKRQQLKQQAARLESAILAEGTPAAGTASTGLEGRVAVLETAFSDQVLVYTHTKQREHQEELDRLNARLSRLEAAVAAGGAYRPQAGGLLPANRTESMPSGPNPSDACFKCGETGHWARDCQSEKTVNAVTTDTYCLNCA